jgi:hypothetical protein
MNIKDYHSKEKTLIKKDIFWKEYNNQPTWKDIKHIEFEDDDIVTVTYVEPYFSENESNDGYFMVSVVRMVEETDEQFQKRMKDVELKNKWAKEQRYNNYLKLKSEFEPDVKCFDGLGVNLKKEEHTNI